MIDHPPESPPVLDLIIEKTAEYLAIPSVVGHEKFFMDFLEHEFQALDLNTYQYDGLMEIQGRDVGEHIVCAHIDRHGLISLGDDEYVYAAQYIKEVKYGENNKSSRKQVESIAERFEGEEVYAYHPDTGEHIGDGIIRACYPKIRNDDALFFVEGIPQLEQNIPLAYSRQARFEDNHLMGQIDNVISIAMIYALYKNGYEGTALLTCEEEIGKSWMHIASYLDGMRIETDELLVIDTSPFSEHDVIEEGPIILRNQDKSEEFNDNLVDKLKARCEKMKLPYIVKDELLLSQGKEIEDLGSTELGRLVEGSEGFWNGATIQIPTLMYHTSNETTTSQAIENYYNFLHNILVEDKI